MSNDNTQTQSEGKIQRPQDLPEKWQPDIYYFPVQVDAELRDIQNNVLGKVLTLIDALGLDSKREKATKDLIRTVIKEQMIRTRRMLDESLNTIFMLGMKPFNNEVWNERFTFTKSYVVTPIYEEKDMQTEGLLD